MRKGIFLLVLALPVVLLALLLTPLWVPVFMALTYLVPGLKAFSLTSDRRTWNIASYHSPHSLTWRWLMFLTFARPFHKPFLHVTREPGFATVGFGLGFAGAGAYQTNHGWNVGASILGLHVQFNQQRPMWYRDLYLRARDEADSLNRRARSALNDALLSGVEKLTDKPVVWVQ